MKRGKVSFSFLQSKELSSEVPVVQKFNTGEMRPAYSTYEAGNLLTNKLFLPRIFSLMLFVIGTEYLFYEAVTYYVFLIEFNMSNAVYVL